MTDKIIEDGPHDHPSNTIDLVKEYFESLSGPHELTFREKFRSTNLESFDVPDGEFYAIDDKFCIHRLGNNNDLTVKIYKENLPDSCVYIDLEYLYSYDLFHTRRTLQNGKYEMTISAKRVGRHYILRIDYHGLGGDDKIHDGTAHPIP